VRDSGDRSARLKAVHWALTQSDVADAAKLAEMRSPTASIMSWC